MNLITTLAVVIGVLGVVATYLFIGPGGADSLQILAGKLVLSLREATRAGAARPFSFNRA
jgi:hypothetical protein